MKDQLTYHERFTRVQLEEQYNLRLSRPDYEQSVIPQWIKQSEVARSQLNCSLDIRYGNGDRQKFDEFLCGDKSAPTLVYFHGGYWQRGDKSIYSFLAIPFTEAGVNVVVAGYDLCPNVTLSQISLQAREALCALYKHINSAGLDADRIAVMGHSAGGHITQMMLGTDWRAVDKDLPVDLIHAGIAISPISFLEPVRLTAELNNTIRMSKAEAESQSPLISHPPCTNAPQLLAVGETETSEFHRQARMYYEMFGDQNRSIELYIVPGVDHFDELNVLADTDSEFFNKAVRLIKNST